MALGKLFRWLQLALEVRIDDVQRRKDKQQKLKEERQELIEIKQAREE